MENPIFFDLEDVLDSITAEDEPSFLEKDRTDFVETIMKLMDTFISENPKEVSEHEFYENFIESIMELIELQFEDFFYLYPQLEEELEDIIEEAAEVFFESGLMPPRSYPTTFILNHHLNKPLIKSTIDYLKAKPQPAQRTKEWYEFRQNLITASNAYKAFENESSRNQLIFEKCQPMPSTDDLNARSKQINTNTTLHWGQKYEPLSVLIYEHDYNTTVGDFGCIQHDKYSFLGASPDGINVDPESERYGRMLEIKNIVNREIDGIPKKEYWIQMQLQMETCNLDECDFLETRFTEYEDSIDPENNDIITARSKFEADGSFSESANKERKGVIMYFAKRDGNPSYEYMPLSIKTQEDFDIWSDEIITKYQNNSMNWIKNIFWKLSEYSCVLVLRNRRWFEDNISEMGELWSIVEKERISGYSHRAPSKRMKKPDEPTANLIQDDIKGNCILSIDKMTRQVSLKVIKIVTQTNTIIEYEDEEVLDEVEELLDEVEEL